VYAWLSDDSAKNKTDTALLGRGTADRIKTERAEKYPPAGTFPGGGHFKKGNYDKKCHITDG
jgi:hypothetical protein